jgi:DNA-binding MarR family transcriptional regulator
MATTSAESAQALAAQVRSALARTTRRLRQEGGGDLSPALTAALATIDRHGPLTPSELAQRERVQRPTATRFLAALSERGLVTRTADPGDGRSSLIATTREGRELLRVLRTRKDAFLSVRLAALSSADRATIERAVELLESIATDEGQR